MCLHKGQRSLKPGILLNRSTGNMNKVFADYVKSVSQNTLLKGEPVWSYSSKKKNTEHVNRLLHTHRAWWDCNRQPFCPNQHPKFFRQSYSFQMSFECLKKKQDHVQLLLSTYSCKPKNYDLTVLKQKMKFGFSVVVCFGFQSKTVPGNKQLWLKQIYPM